ncbi:MAG: glycerophosphodiester phosphodiesterase [Mycobacterium sp.]
MDWPGPIAFAHRGDSAHAPENTMAAFEAAVSLGFSYLETDAHATRDGRLIAFHDDRLDRVTDRRGSVEHLSWRDIRLARVDGREPIPLLEDLLQAWPETRFNIDPKSDSAVGPLITAIRRCHAIDRVCIGSFSRRRLDRMKAALGEKLCVSMTPTDAARLLIGSRSGIRRPFDAPCAQLPTRRGRLAVCDRRLVRYAHARGIEVHGWTVNNPVEMAALLDIGIDGIMTDDPRSLRSVLTQRGQWFSG